MIICSNCNTILDDTPGSTEMKLCMKCVRDMTPGADKSKILRPDSQEETVNRMIKNGKSHAVQTPERFKSMELGFDYEKIEGEIRVVFEIKDYFKKPFFGFALSKKDLMAFVGDIEDIEKEAE